MELRRCSHYHFIKTIKADSVTRVLNVSHGKPALKFKTIKDIYESQDERTHSPLGKGNMESEFVKVQVECTCLPSVNRRSTTISSETSTLSYNSSHDNDDLSFGNMTLQMLMNRSKSKKRKCLSTSNFPEQTLETHSPIKQDYLSSQAGEDESDLQQPLSTLKMKRSKKPEAKNKCMQKQFFISSICENPLQFQENLLAPCDVKVEVPEPDNLDTEDMIHAASDQSVVDASMVSHQVAVIESNHSYSNISVSVEAEIPEPNQSDLQTTDFTVDSSVDYHGTRLCDAELSEPQSSYDQNVTCGACISAPGCDKDMASSDMLNKCTENVMEAEASISFYKESQDSSVSEAYDDYSELVSSISVSNAKPVGTELVEVQNPEVTEHGNSELPVLALEDEGDFTNILPYESSPTTISPTSHMCNSQSSPSMIEISCQKDGFERVEVSDTVIDNSFRIMEHSHIDVSCKTNGGTKDGLHTNAQSSVVSTPLSNYHLSSDSNPCLSLDSYLDSLADDSVTVRIKEPGGEARNSSGELCPSAGIVELATSLDAESSHCLEMHYTPERLPSNRKVISPTSQERLCKEMKAAALHDDTEGHYKSMRKLYFGKQCLNKINKSKRAHHIRRTVATVSNWVTSKQVGDNNKINHKGNSKVLYLSHEAPHVNSGCSSIQSCSQSAITFSQRQMQDIEGLATKLTKELTSMKDILEDVLYSEAPNAKSLKYHPSEVRTAISKATKAEETTKKWISMMSKDCTRFCKLMNLTVKSSDASKNLTNKEAKKVKFADEAGGELCRVKLIEDDMVTASESDIVKQE